MPKTISPTATTNPEDLDVLSKKALMVRLITKKINRNAVDKDLNAFVQKAKKVKDKGAVRVSKSILPKDDTDVYTKLQAEAKKYFYRVTTPWDDHGWRLLSVDIHKTFTKKMKSYTTEFKEKVYHFIDNIEASIESMKEDLGGTFKAADYNKIFKSDGSVDREYLLGQFNLETMFDTVTTGKDIRASLTEDDRKILAEEINKRAQEKFALSQTHIIAKLHDAVTKMHKRLCVSDATFRDTLVGNIEELCDIIPLMNIAKDPAIDKLAAEAKAELTKFDPQELRDDPIKREDISKKADKMAKNMEGMI